MDRCYDAFNYFYRPMPRLPIFCKAVAALCMITALLFLTTANCWVYGGNSEKKAVSALSDSAQEEQDTGPSVPNPVEEKNSNTLQNLSEYLHDHQYAVLHPVCISSFGNRHDIINFPVHYLELVIPPPKSLG